MSRSRREVTARVVSLHSPEASDATVEGTIEERLAMLARLSETSWTLTGRPLPHYSRATMPVAVTMLQEQSRRA